MKAIARISRSIRLGLALSLLLLCLATGSFAQEIVGLSYAYEQFPYTELAEPDANTQGLEIQTAAHTVGAAFPFVFKEGKIV